MKEKDNPYGDMLYLPHHVSSQHPRMPLLDRAAQFSPFAALTGYNDAILEAARMTEARIELDESRKALLNRRLTLVREHSRERPEIAITYFLEDGKKAGGTYGTVSGPVKKIDEYDGSLIMCSGEKIPIEDILDMKGALFHALDE